MKSILKRSILAVSVLGLGFTLIGCAPKSFDDRIDYGTTAAKYYLDLTDAQEPALQELTTTVKVNYPEFKAIRTSLQDTLKAELGKEQFDVERVNTEMDRVKEKAETVSQEIVAEFAAFHQVLTPEQRAKIAQHTRDKDGNRFHRSGRGPWGEKRRHPHGLRNLNIQPEQAPALKKLASGIAVDSVDLMLAKNQLQQILKEELSAENFDKDRVENQIQATIQLVFASVDRRLPEFATLHALFSAEQREILVNAVDQWGTARDVE